MKQHARQFEVEPEPEEKTEEEKGKPTIALEQATGEDVDFAYRLYKVNAYDRVDATRGWDKQEEYAKTLLKFTPGFDKVIRVRGERAGIFRALNQEDDSVLIDRFELLPKFQNRGVGYKVLSDFLKEHADQMVQVEIPKKSSTQKRSAVELFRRLGFEVIGETEMNYKLIKSPGRYIV